MLNVESFYLMHQAHSRSAKILRNAYLLLNPDFHIGVIRSDIFDIITSEEYEGTLTYDNG